MMDDEMGRDARKFSQNFFPKFLRGVQGPSGRFPLLALLTLTLLLYLSTLDNGFLPRELEGGDLITHQYAQVQARPSNAPGYPLYTMGGWLWFHGLRGLARLAGNPLPNPIPILSSYSTLWAMVALWLFYLTFARLTHHPNRSHRGWLLTWLVSAFYAVTYFFWYYATTTEQYSSAIAQTLAIFYVYLCWRDEALCWRDEALCWRNEAGEEISFASTADASTRVANRTFYLLVLLCGISLAHMLTVALMVPPLVLVVLWQAPQLLRSARTVLRTMLVALLPLVSYLYVYVRGAAHPEWWGAGNWHNATEWFWAFLSTAQGREELSWGLEAGRPFWGGGFPEMMWQELSVPLWGLGLLGILFLGRRLAVLLYGTLLLYAAFCWAYRFGNWYQVVLPAYPLILLGIAGWCNEARRRLSGQARTYARYAAAALLVGAIVWRLLASLPGADSRNRADDTALAHATALIAQPLPEGGALFAPVQDALALQYLIDIWAIRPDLRVVSSRVAATVLEANGQLFATTEAAVTLLDELPAALPVVLLDQSADWVRFYNPMGGRPTTMSMPSTLLAEPALPGVMLAGYRATAAPASSALDLTLFWQLEGGVWPEQLSISVRPTLDGGFIDNSFMGAAEGETSREAPNQIVQQDRAGPVHGLFGLSAPAVDGQLVSDAYRLPLPSPLPEGANGIRVILYRQGEGGFENVADLAFPLHVDIN